MVARPDLLPASTWPSGVSSSSSWRKRRVLAKAGDDSGIRFACSPQHATTACLGCLSPAKSERTPRKEQMADYLQKYAERFGLPVRLGIEVLGLTKNDRGLFVVECADRSIEADQVIVAIGTHATQRMPGFAAALDPQIIQRTLESIEVPTDYRNQPS